MKRSIVSLAATLLAFAAGVGVNRLIWTPSEKNTLPVPSVETVAAVSPVVEPVTSAITPVEPLQEGKIILDYNSKTFAPEGGYNIIGQTPKGFAEFDGFAITYYEDNGRAESGEILVVTKADETYQTVPAIFGFVTERRVVFLTSPDPKTEFEYRFDGEFIRSNFDDVSGTPKPVLRGTLTKTKSGRKVAERVISLRLVRHEC